MNIFNGLCFLCGDKMIPEKQEYAEESNIVAIRYGCKKCKIGAVRKFEVQEFPNSLPNNILQLREIVDDNYGMWFISDTSSAKEIFEKVKSNKKRSLLYPIDNSKYGK